MRFLILSDLHIEFGKYPFALPDPETYDAVILAGDIGVGLSGVKWAVETFPDKDVVYVPGNHEYYHRNMTVLKDKFKTLKDNHVLVLDNGTVTVDDVTIIGGTLWTDFLLYDTPEQSSKFAGRCMNDYATIQYNEFRILEPSMTSQMFIETVHYIDKALEFAKENEIGKTLVVTHHAPSPSSIHPTFANSTLNPAFTSNLDNFILKHQPNMWIHGHVHNSMDYNIGKTRIVCNPKGYPLARGSNKIENPNFNPDFIVEI